jgi:hypothetical protein
MTASSLAQNVILRDWARTLVLGVDRTLEDYGRKDQERLTDISNRFEMFVALKWRQTEDQFMLIIRRYFDESDFSKIVAEIHERCEKC